MFSGFWSCLSSCTTNLEAAKISHRPEKNSQSIRQLKLPSAVPPQRIVSHGVCAAADERQQILSTKSTVAVAAGGSGCPGVLCRGRGGAHHT